MVTLTKIGDEYNSQVLEITGLSTDEKPIGSIDGIAISNGSVFKEINTGSEYLYNAESNEWVKNTASATSVSGKDGEDGVTPLLQKSSTAIQVSYDNGSTYEDLVPLSEITGEKGATGATGADGKSAYQIWLDAGNTGDEAAFLASLKGENYVSIASIILNKDTDGNISGGSATLTDGSTVNISVRKLMGNGE